jgi:outer membrane protein assembly factor BamB
MRQGAGLGFVVIGLAVLIPSALDGPPVHLGITCELGSPTHECASPGTVRWWFPLYGPQPGTPADADQSRLTEGGGLVFYEEAGLILAFERRTGQLRWAHGTHWGPSQRRELTFGDGLLAVQTPFDWGPGLGHDETVIFDATSGDHLLTSFDHDQLLALVEGAAIFVDDHVVPPRGSDTGVRISAVDARSGKRRWSVPGPPCCRWPSPAPLIDVSGGLVAGGILFLGGPSLVQRIDLRTGAGLPDLMLGAIPELRPVAILAAVAPSGALMLSRGLTTAAVDGATGRLLWSATGRVNCNGRGFMGIDQAKDEGDVVYICGPSSIEARDAKSGQTRWTAKQWDAVPCPHPCWEGMAWRGELVAGRTESNTVTWTGIDTRSGHGRWTMAVPVDRGFAVDEALSEQPPLLMTVVCALDGWHPDRHYGERCDDRRLVAVNW